MAEIYASCGHRLKRNEWATLNPVTVKAMTRECERATKYLLPCSLCLKHAELKKVVLHTQAEIDAWLSGDDPSTEVW